MKDQDLVAALESRLGPLTPDQIARLDQPVETAPEAPGAPHRPASIPAPPRKINDPHPVWNVGQSAITGQWHVMVIYDRGAGLVDRAYFIGHPDKLTKFKKDHTGAWQAWKYHGETCPAEVIEIYRQHFDPSNAGLGIPGINDPGPAPDTSRVPTNSYSGPLPQKG